MGYFDGLISGSFKTAQDGRRLFFPWGIFGRGYVLASEEDYLRLRKQVKTRTVVSFLLVLFTPLALGYIITAALLVLLFGFYLVWMSFVLRGLEAANEGLTWNEGMTASARAFGPVTLWLLVICSLTFVACAIWMLIVDPRQWLVAASGILLFGLAAAKSVRMLILRKRSMGVET